MPKKHSLLYYQIYYFFHTHYQKKGKVMPENESTMPSPFPLEAAVNSTADLKNAELVADELPSNTEKVISKTKMTDSEFHKLALSKGYMKKPKDKAMWEILMLISWISWISMVITYTVNWLGLVTVTGAFMPTWAVTVTLIKEIAISFTSVVLGQATKLLNQWYENKQKGKEL
jgi:hypothetical protein